jgi:nitrogen fixation/metabolism regulation signal transduction histidine kinase
MVEQDLLAALPKPIVIVSARLDVRFANQAFAELFRRRGEDWGELTEAIRCAPALGAALTRAVSKLRTVGWTSDCRWSPATDDGRVFEVHVTRARQDTYVAVFDEISQHLKIEEIQSRARGYLEAVLNHLKLGVIVLDADFNTTFFNRDQAALLQRLGVEKSIFEVIGAPISETYPIFNAEEWESIYSRVLRSGEMVMWSKLPYPRQNPASYFQVNFVPLAAEEDRLPGAICITDDVTRTVGLENELIRKERLALVGQMTIALNHEINNPLTAILGTAESLLFNQSLTPELMSRLETIRGNSLRIVDVTRRLREIEEIHLTEYIQGGPMMLDLRAGVKNGSAH